MKIIGRWRWGRCSREREGMCKGPEAGSVCMLWELTGHQCGWSSLENGLEDNNHDWEAVTSSQWRFRWKEPHEGWRESRQMLEFPDLKLWQRCPLLPPIIYKPVGNPAVRKKA